MKKRNPRLFILNGFGVTRRRMFGPVFRTGTPRTLTFCGRATLLALAMFLLVSPAQADDGEASFKKSVEPFLTRYCTACHGPKQQKGDRRFDGLNGIIVDSNALADYQDVLDLLNLGEMPPAKALQPKDQERRVVVLWLTGAIQAWHRDHKTSEGRATLRRLNSREYRNTVRDLLSLNMTMFDPATKFPRDQTVVHLDNVGSELVTSGYLLQQYLSAAEQVIDKAMYPLEKPAVQTWKFQDSFRQQPEIDQVFRSVGEFQYMTLFDVIGADKPEGAYGPIHAFADGVPFDGVYEIRVKAEALNREHPYNDALVGTDRSQPFRLGIRPGLKHVGNLHLTQPVEPLLAEIELADEEKWYTVRVWLDAGYTPRFTFRNGLMDARGMWAKIVRKYPEQFPKRVRPGIVEDRYNAIRHGKLPQIRIEEVEIEGPLYDQWPTASQRSLLGEHWKEAASGELTDQQQRLILTRFATRAYRRPVSTEEVERVFQVVQSRQEGGRSPLEALSDGFKVVLCSPGFLYLQPAEGDATTLSASSLASRLSYFLWSSAPDEEILQAASTNRLREPSNLATQVERMLNDPRSDSFIDGFLGSWLTLRDLGSTPPDRAAFEKFYRFDLDTAMRQETKLFVRHMIEENLSISNFLDSDFTFVNKRLAEHYGLNEVPPTAEFKRVTLTDRRRGGLLGQASVLTVTANGIDTSPVVRGVWLLENIMGTPPSPPPPDVEPLDPDVRGATTIREQLQMHRDVPACFDCHRKIDPMGFALENFDPIGGWRTSYSRNLKIDSSGEMPDGQKYRSVEEFKQILLSRKSLFARALAGRLLAYAIGRPVERSDRPHIDRIVASLEEEGYGLRDLIRLVVTSELFQTP